MSTFFFSCFRFLSETDKVLAQKNFLQNKIKASTGSCVPELLHMYLTQYFYWYVTENRTRNLRPYFLAEGYCFTQEHTGKTKMLLAATEKLNVEGRNQPKNQEAKRFTNQKLKPVTIPGRFLFMGL